MRRLFSQEPTRSRISVLLKQPRHARRAVLTVLLADLLEFRELFGEWQRRVADSLAVQEDQRSLSRKLEPLQPVSND
jgi:hypothetical protein